MAGKPFMTRIGHMKAAQREMGASRGFVADPSRRTITRVAETGYPALQIGEHGFRTCAVIVEIHVCFWRAQALLTDFRLYDLDPQNLRSVFPSPLSLAVLEAAAEMAEINGHRSNLSLKGASLHTSSEIKRQFVYHTLQANGRNRKRTAREPANSNTAHLYKSKKIGLGDPSAIHRYGVAI
jgi:hypothetical protein